MTKKPRTYRLGGVAGNRGAVCSPEIVKAWRDRHRRRGGQRIRSAGAVTSGRHRGARQGSSRRSTTPTSLNRLTVTCRKRSPSARPPRSRTSWCCAPGSCRLLQRCAVGVLQGRRRRPDHQPGYWNMAAISSLRNRRLANRAPAAARSSAVPEASGWRLPNCWQPRSAGVVVNSRDPSATCRSRTDFRCGTCRFAGADPAVADALIEACVREFGRIDIDQLCRANHGIVDREINEQCRVR